MDHVSQTPCVVTSTGRAETACFCTYPMLHVGVPISGTYGPYGFQVHLFG